MYDNPMPENGAVGVAIQQSENRQRWKQPRPDGIKDWEICLHQTMGNTWTWCAIISFLLLVVIIVPAAVLSSQESVEYHFVALDAQAGSNGITGTELYHSGRQWNSDPRWTLKQFDISRINLDFNGGSRIVGPVAGGGTVGLDITVNLFLPEDGPTLKSLDETLGSDMEGKLRDTVRATVLGVMLNYPLEDYRSPRRRDIRSAMRAAVTDTLVSEHVLFESFYLRDVHVSAALEDAVEDRAFQLLHTVVLEAERELYDVTNTTALMQLTGEQEITQERARKEQLIEVEVNQILRQVATIEAETTRELEQLDAAWEAELAKSEAEGRDAVGQQRLLVDEIVSAASLEAAQIAAEADRNITAIVTETQVNITRFNSERDRILADTAKNLTTAQAEFEATRSTLTASADADILVAGANASETIGTAEQAGAQNTQQELARVLADLQQAGGDAASHEWSRVLRQKELGLLNLETALATLPQYRNQFNATV